MSFLEKLKRDKANRENYEREQLKLKQLIFDIHVTHSKVGEPFLDMVQDFIHNYNKEHNAKREFKNCQ
jgi:hypothetical protein